MSRLSKIKKMFKIRKYKGHLQVKSWGTHRYINTSIKSNLTKFELDSVYIHIYKLYEKYTNRVIHFDKVLDTVNYADVFGSPWSLR